MGPAKSVTYNVADEEKGEEAFPITVAFKAQANESRDNIKACFNLLTEQQLCAIMTNPDNVLLKAAYDHILDKHSEFPFSK